MTEYRQTTELPPHPYRRITPQEVEHLFSQLNNYNPQEYNWVIASMHGAIGAGHLREALGIKEALKKFGIPPAEIILISLEYADPQQNPLNNLIGISYTLLQNHPEQYNIVL